MGLRAARIEKGLSVSDLAQATGVDRTSISNYENGNRGLGPDKLKILADHLGLTVHQITTPRRVNGGRTAHEPSDVIDSAIVLRYCSVDELRRMLAEATRLEDWNSVSAIGAELAKRPIPASPAKFKYPTTKGTPP